MKLEDECTLVELVPFRHLMYVREIFADHFHQHAMTPTSLDWPRFICVAYCQCNDAKKMGVGRLWYTLNDSVDGVKLDPLPDDRGGRLVVPASIQAGVASRDYDPGLIQRQRATFINARARWELLEGRREQARADKAAKAAALAPVSVTKRAWWKLWTN